MERRDCKRAAKNGWLDGGKEGKLLGVVSSSRSEQRRVLDVRVRLRDFRMHFKRL